MHSDEALRELVRSLTAPDGAGGPPPDYAMPSDFPERYTRGARVAAWGRVTLRAVGARAWRSTASATMTFAGRCEAAAADVGTFEQWAPNDMGMWLALTQPPRGAALAAPVGSSLAVHATADVGAFPAPASAVAAGAGAASWCGVIECLRASARDVLRAAGIVFE